MKAVRIHEDGGPEVLRYEDVEDPVAGEGEVLIRLRAASLNHIDLWVRQGLPSVPTPRTPTLTVRIVGIGLPNGRDRHPVAESR